LFLGLSISAEEIIKDRKHLKRESFLGLSRNSYLHSKISLLILISAIQMITFVLISNFILEIRGMTFHYWLILFSTSCFANMLGLNISSALNSVITIYILIPFILVPELLFSGIGEPLLHPNILEMGALAKSKGIPRVRLTTNATLLTEQKTEEILKGKICDEIGFSLDALTEETYKKLKKGAQFQTVEENIAHFLYKKGNRGRPFVSLHMLKMKETAPEIDGFIQKWKPLLGKGDHILVKDVHDFAGQVEDRRPGVQPYVGKRLPCRQLWNFLYVSWDGDVMPCCIDPLRRLKIGNLNQSSLEELWNGPLIQEIRHIHLQGRYKEIPLCSGCANWWY